MLFDFETFKKLVNQCYDPGPYSLGVVLLVFKYYFYCYEQKFGEAHPHIKMGQIDELTSGEYKVRCTVVKSSRLDTNALRKVAPELCKKFTRSVDTKRFCVS